MKNEIKKYTAVILFSLSILLFLFSRISGQYGSGKYGSAGGSGAAQDLSGYVEYAADYVHLTGDSVKIDGKLTVSGVITCAGFYVATDSSLIVKTDSIVALVGNRLDFRGADTVGMKKVVIDTMLPYTNKFVLKSDSIIYSLTHQIYGRTGDTSRFLGVVSVVNKLRMDTIGAINGLKMTFGADTFAAGAGNVLIFGDGNDTIATNLFKAKTGNRANWKAGDTLGVNKIALDTGYGNAGRYVVLPDTVQIGNATSKIYFGPKANNDYMSWSGTVVSFFNNSSACEGDFSIVQATSYMTTPEIRSNSTSGIKIHGGSTTAHTLTIGSQASDTALCAAGTFFAIPTDSGTGLAPIGSLFYNATDSAIYLKRGSGWAKVGP